jgi:hypothetical protein
VVRVACSATALALTFVASPSAAQAPAPGPAAPPGPAPQQYPPGYGPLPPPEPAEPAPRGPYQQSLGPYHRPPNAGDDDEQEERPEYETKEPPHQHRHDGLYLRIAGGLGGTSDGLEATSSKFARNDPAGGQTFDDSATGWAVATEVAIGATPFRGFVIGIGIETMLMPGPEADEAGIGGGKYTFAITQLEQFEAFADYYINPRGGLHFQGGIGFAALVMGQGTANLGGPATRAYTATGVGGMLGGGYEWWVADDWGVGVLARFMYASLSATDSDGIDWSHGTLGWALMLSTTYH